MRVAFLLLALLCFGCRQKPCEKATDFETLMGANNPKWSHVHTKEDWANLAFFKEVYEKNISHLGEAGEKIPKVLHYIWMGPKAFPRKSVENVKSWIIHHPDWKVKFWTDRNRPLPHPSLELCLIGEFEFQRLEPYFWSSENYAERSDLLRLEILFQEGGIYVDHDVKCMRSFSPLIGGYDFFCGMELPYPTSLPSSVLPTNNLIGSRPGHPLVDKIMDWLDERWDALEKAYPGNDRDSLINRVAHRTFSSLGETFKVHANEQGNVDIALPTFYFNAPKEEDALFCQHQYAGTWFENESPFERNVRKRLMKLSKKSNQMLLGLGILAGINVLGWIGLFALVLHKRRSGQLS